VLKILVCTLGMCYKLKSAHSSLDSNALIDKLLTFLEILFIVTGPAIGETTLTVAVFLGLMVSMRSGQNLWAAFLK
jgi:hypothetical protein